MNIPGRLPADTFDLILGESYPCRMSIARDPQTDAVVEVVLKPSGTAGKSGGSLDLIFFDLGIALSRALQGRDPVAAPSAAAPTRDTEKKIGGEG